MRFFVLFYFFLGTKESSFVAVYTVSFLLVIYSQFSCYAVSFVVRNTVTAVLLLMLKITVGMVENISVQYIIRLCAAGK